MCWTNCVGLFNSQKRSAVNYESSGRYYEWILSGDTIPWAESADTKQPENLTLGKLADIAQTEIQRTPEAIDKAVYMLDWIGHNQ